MQLCGYEKERVIVGAVGISGLGVVWDVNQGHEHYNHLVFRPFEHATREPSRWLFPFSLAIADI